jgi:hypothetical protein
MAPFGAQICEWSELSHCEPPEPICLEDRGWKEIGRTSILLQKLLHGISHIKNTKHPWCNCDNEGADGLDYASFFDVLTSSDL